jgi:chaperonin GroEL
LWASSMDSFRKVSRRILLVIRGVSETQENILLIPIHIYDVVVTAGHRLAHLANKMSSSSRSMQLSMAKKLSFKGDSRSKIVDGINIVANAVKITLGPKGRNVVLERSYGSPEIVNDGVTIARDITLEDPEMNVGAKLLQEVASKSDKKAGDGTTTSILMTQEIVNQGLRVVEAGTNPVSVRKGIMNAASALAARVKELAKQVSGDADLLNIAKIASGSEIMGSIIATAFSKIADNGSAVVEESQTLNDEVEFTEGEICVGC